MAARGFGYFRVRIAISMMTAQHRLQRTGGLRRPKGFCAIIELLGPTSPTHCPPLSQTVGRFAKTYKEIYFE